MAKTKKSVGFSLAKIKTEQFAIIKDAFTEGPDVGLDLGVQFGLNVENKILSVLFKSKLLQNKNPFLVLEVGSYFNIDKTSWEGFINKEANTITFPKGFITHLVVITIGTSRGVLHSKTENTFFNQFVLPTINVNELIKGDVILSMNIEK